MVGGCAVYGVGGWVDVICVLRLDSLFRDNETFFIGVFFILTPFFSVDYSFFSNGASIPISLDPSRELSNSGTLFKYPVFERVTEAFSMLP